MGHDGNSAAHFHIDDDSGRVCFSLACDAGMALASSATIVISGSALLIATEG
jgi:hypothetical protein